MKTRSSSGVGQKVDLEFNVDTLRINDLGEDDQPQQPSANQIYQGLKRTSSTASENQDPAQGISINKFKPQSKTTTDIRSMLAGINPEKD
jgi:hypothetical protein